MPACVTSPCTGTVSTNIGGRHKPRNKKFERATVLVIHSLILLSSGASLIRHFRVLPGLCIKNEVKCSAFDVEMIFHSYANKPHFHKKGCALGLILKVKVFGTRKGPIAWAAKNNQEPDLTYSSLLSPIGNLRYIFKYKIHTRLRGSGE